MKLGKRYIKVVHGSEVNSIMVDLPTKADTRPHHWLVVDVDACPPSTASEVEQHERPFIYHAEALARLGAPTPVVDEIERLRAENERMRAVVEAADDLCERWGLRATPDNPGDVGRLSLALTTYRAGQPARPTPLRCAWCASGGQTHLQSSCTCAGTLTPAEWEALDELRKMASPNSYSTILTARGDRLLVSAIDKIRAARGSRP